MYIGLPKADLTWAAAIQLLLKPKLLWRKSLLQHRQEGAVYVYNVHDWYWDPDMGIIPNGSEKGTQLDPL